jgi:hypothetical protein
MSDITKVSENAEDNHVQHQDTGSTVVQMAFV